MQAERINLILSRVTLRKMQQSEALVTGYKKDKPEEELLTEVIDERNALMECACIVSALAFMFAFIAYFIVCTGM